VFSMVERAALCSCQSIHQNPCETVRFRGLKRGRPGKAVESENSGLEQFVSCFGYEIYALSKGHSELTLARVSG
jgi:hypothetical protein